MKALVLCGGAPQIALLGYLRDRGIFTVLADMNERVAGRAHADKFYPVSVLDVDGVCRVATEEKVDFVITVCADQVLQVVAEVSERLGLPCYIDFETAVNVSKKSYMKRIFSENGIPSSAFVMAESPDDPRLSALRYPLIVKPVDSYSSRGVKKVSDVGALQEACDAAAAISRTGSVIVEEFVEGDELTVDVYVENGTARVLCISHLDKIGEDGKFVIHRTRYPAQISLSVGDQIAEAAQRIADAFGLANSPMLIQLITDGESISVVEFCARTGGGDKFRLIEKATGFDVVRAVADLTLGELPHVGALPTEQKFITDEFIYCRPGTFDHLEGFDELVEEGIITEYFQLKASGTKLGPISSSGDRVAYFTVEADTLREAREKHALANARIKAISDVGEDILRHDLVGKGF